jgi:hypothetical protein
MRKRLEITCITKVKGHYRGERIIFVGGLFPNRKKFRFTQNEAIKAIEENKYDFFTKRDGKVLDVIISETIDEEKYLKSIVDWDHPFVLLNLPECE